MPQVPGEPGRELRQQPRARPGASCDNSPPPGRAGPTQDRSVARYVVTDITKDGTMCGPYLDLLREVCAATDWR